MIQLFSEIIVDEIWLERKGVRRWQHENFGIAVNIFQQ